MNDSVAWKNGSVTTVIVDPGIKVEKGAPASYESGLKVMYILNMPI